MRLLPGLGVQILLSRLGVRMILLSGLRIVRLLLSEGLEVVWILLFYLTISSNEITVAMGEFEEAVGTVFNEHSIHAFGIFNYEILKSWACVAGEISLILHQGSSAFFIP